MSEKPIQPHRAEEPTCSGYAALLLQHSNHIS